MSTLTELPPLQQTILRKLLLRQLKRPRPFNAYDVYRLFDYRKYSDEEVYRALDELLKQGYIKTNENGHFLIPRDRYLDIKRHHKWLLFLYNSDLFVIPIIAAVALFSIIYLTRGVFQESSQDRLHVLSALENNAAYTIKFDERLQKIERKIASMETIPSDVNQAAALLEMQNKVQQLETSAINLTEALHLDPSKTIQLSVLRSDLESVRNELKLVSQSLQREIERVSSYNNNIIIFMITFLVALVALMGIVIFDYFKNRRRSG